MQNDWCAALWQLQTAAPALANHINTPAAAAPRSTALQWTNTKAPPPPPRGPTHNTVPAAVSHAPPPPSSSIEQQLQTVRAQLGLGPPRPPPPPRLPPVPSLPLPPPPPLRALAPGTPLATPSSVPLPSADSSSSPYPPLPPGDSGGVELPRPPPAAAAARSAIRKATSRSFSAGSSRRAPQPTAAAATAVVAAGSDVGPAGAGEEGPTRPTTRALKAKQCYECRMAQKAGQLPPAEHVCASVELKSRKRTHWVLLSALPAALHSSVRTVDQLSKFERDFYRPLEAFYSGKENYIETVILPLVTRPRVDKRLSARLINWLAACYTLCDAATGNKVDIVYEVTWDGQLLETEEERVAWQKTQPEDRRNSSWGFNLETSYRTVLHRDTKDLFDPFRRGPWLAVKLRNRDDSFLTTLGQLNFMAWAIRWQVLEYARRHHDEINAHMRKFQPVRPRPAAKRRRLASEPVHGTDGRRRSRRHSALPGSLFDESEEDDDDDGDEDDEVPSLPQAAASANDAAAATSVITATNDNAHEGARGSNKVALATQGGALPVPASMTRLAAAAVADGALEVRVLSAAAIRRRRRPSTYHATANGRGGSALTAATAALPRDAGVQELLPGGASARSSRKRKLTRPGLSGSERFWLVQTAPTGAIVPVVTAAAATSTTVPTAAATLCPTSTSATFGNEAEMPGI